MVLSGVLCVLWTSEAAKYTPVTVGDTAGKGRVNNAPRACPGKARVQHTAASVVGVLWRHHTSHLHTQTGCDALPCCRRTPPWHAQPASGSRDGVACFFLRSGAGQQFAAHCSAHL